MTARSYLVALRLVGRRSVVVGGGPEAEKRTRALLASGAVVRVVTTTPSDAISLLAREGRIELCARPLEDLDVADAWLAILCDADPDLASRMNALAERHRVQFCALDQPGHATFWHLAVSRHGPLAVAVSTEGRAPALARRVREELDVALEEAGAAAFAETVAEARGTPELDALLGRIHVSMEIDDE